MSITIINFLEMIAHDLILSCLAWVKTAIQLLFSRARCLTENTHLVKEVFVAEQKMFRVTMTADLINQARNIIFLVEGKGKAEILNTVLTAPYQPDRYPAQLINPHMANYTGLLTSEAASLLIK